MAGDWIKMRTNLEEDPRVIAMSTDLEIPELHVIGCLWKIWKWAGEFTTDGNALSVTEKMIDDRVKIPGFATAYRNVGWLEGNDGDLTLPRFDEHNGQTAKRRALTKNRVQNKRSKTCNADSVTREEKRREEKNKTSSPKPPPRESEEEDLKNLVRDAGVDLHHVCVRTALENGMTPDQIRAVVDHYRSKQPAWNPGALYSRLTRVEAPSLSPDKGWPAADPKAVHERDNEKLALAKFVDALTPQEIEGLVERSGHSELKTELAKLGGANEFRNHHRAILMELSKPLMRKPQ